MKSCIMYNKYNSRNCVWYSSCFYQNKLNIKISSALEKKVSECFSKFEQMLFYWYVFGFGSPRGWFYQSQVFLVNAAKSETEEEGGGEIRLKRSSYLC